MCVIYWRIKDGKLYDAKTAAQKIGSIVIPASIICSTGASGLNISAQIKPLIEAVKDLAEPVAYGFMVFGGIKYITGHAAEGQKILKSAISGYVLIQWIPWIFGIIKGIGG